jgi:hypothetical protein
MSSCQGGKEFYVKRLKAGKKIYQANKWNFSESKTPGGDHASIWFFS